MKSDDTELEALKRRRLAEMQKMLTAKQQKALTEHKKMTPEKILEKVFVGRAWEVYRAARQQYPQVAAQVFQELAALVDNGRLKGQITGEQLFWLLRQIGLDVRLDTKIQILEHGELKSLADKFREA